MNRIVFDAPPWWQRPGWQIAAAAVLAGVALAIWWTVLTPIDHDPIVARTPPTPTVMARARPAQSAAVAPAVSPVVPPAAMPPAAMPQAQPTPAPPPLSTMGVPGALDKTLSLPPGVSVQSETEAEDNLEN